MKRTAKKCIVACLVMSLLLAMLPMVSVSAAAPALDIITDVEFKTIDIQGNIPALANQQASIVIMDKDYTGDFSEVFANQDLIVALDQVSVDANGKFSYYTVLAEVEAEANYPIFINGAFMAASIKFDAPTGIRAGDQITLPIIVKNATNFSGLTGVVNYDPEFFTLEDVAGADGFLLTGMDNTFAVVTKDGMGVDGDVVVGYVILTANDDLVEDTLTDVSFEICEAYDAALEVADVRIPSTKFVVYEDVLPGDVDLNGVVDLRDAILLLQYLSKNTTLSPKALRAADVLADGIVNTADAVVIMQMSLPEAE